jgi:hypothetical protein
VRDELKYSSQPFSSSGFSSIAEDLICRVLVTTQNRKLHPSTVAFCQSMLISTGWLLVK